MKTKARVLKHAGARRRRGRGDEKGRKRLPSKPENRGERELNASPRTTGNVFHFIGLQRGLKTMEETVLQGQLLTAPLRARISPPPRSPGQHAAQPRPTAPALTCRT